MTDFFLPYDVCLDLKSLGFAEITLMYYPKKALDDDPEIDPPLSFEPPENFLPAILYEQAIDWLESKHQKFITLLKFPKSDPPYQWFIGANSDAISYQSRREALLAAVTEVIQIIIVEQEKIPK